MTNIVKNVDSFEGWEDGVEGNERPEGAGIIQGILAKFTNEATWTTRDGDELPALELVAVNVGRVVQKWSEDGQPVETIILEPHQKFPDIEEMNEKIPRTEWVEGPDGQMRGPWQAQHILYLLDPTTMNKYTYPTGTAGGRIAIRELHNKIMWMRRLRGQTVYPVIVLSSAFMKTRFGGRQRPHFQIVRWVRLGGEGDEVKALPLPQPPPRSDLPVVEEPSLREELNDDIPDFENEETKDSKAPAAGVKPVQANVKAPPNRRRRAG
jgi:hypothetical protein